MSETGQVLSQEAASLAALRALADDESAHPVLRAIANAEYHYRLDPEGTKAFHRAMVEGAMQIGPDWRGS